MYTLTPLELIVRSGSLFCRTYSVARKRARGFRGWQDECCEAILMRPLDLVGDNHAVLQTALADGATLDADAVLHASLRLLPPMLPPPEEIFPSPGAVPPRGRFRRTSRHANASKVAPSPSPQTSSTSWPSDGWKSDTAVQRRAAVRAALSPIRLFAAAPPAATRASATPPSKLSMPTPAPFPAAMRSWARLAFLLLASVPMPAAATVRELACALATVRRCPCVGSVWAAWSSRAAAAALGSGGDAGQLRHERRQLSRMKPGFRSHSPPNAQPRQRASVSPQHCVHACRQSFKSLGPQWPCATFGRCKQSSATFSQSGLPSDTCGAHWRSSEPGQRVR